MARRTFEIEGLSELLAGLQELPKATGTNVQKRTLTKAADLFQNDAEARAPVRTGTLQRSVTVGPKLSSRQRSITKKESKVEIYTGPGALVQAITNEFGTAHSAAQPFMRPAWDGNKIQALEGVKDDLSEEIKKAAARIARKTARQAAALRK